MFWQLGGQRTEQLLLLSLDRVPTSENVVALTFDDGPHPVWTPAILDELDRLDVRATFFVVGERVADHPDVVREIVDRGHEVGNHTHFHPLMGDLQPRQMKAQLDLALAAEAAGWDGFFIWDHVNFPGMRSQVDPWITLGVIASQTERLILGRL